MNAERERDELRHLAEQFSLPGNVTGTEPLLSGHINESYRVDCSGPTEPLSFLLQRINREVFTRPDLVMSNVARVTEHIRSKRIAADVDEVDRRVLTLTSTSRGGDSYRDGKGEIWRLYRFIEGITVRQTVASPADAETAGRAFGEFQALLADLDPPPLAETIPDFHNTPLRVQALRRAVQDDPHQRAASARAEIEAMMDRRSLASALVDLQSTGALPLRTVHNDCKLSNVLLDDQTGEALCIVDLDTVMPGTALHDFGDMVRALTTLAAEDEPDASQVHISIELFEALGRGYLQATRDFLSDAEREHLVLAGRVITCEQALRFLTDHLRGDIYYRTARANHNLDRARTQIAMLQSIERYESELQAIVRSL